MGDRRLRNILMAARQAGLVLWFERDRMLVRGPKRAEPVVRTLARHKADILAAWRSGRLDRRKLAFRYCDDLRPGDVCPGWEPDAWAAELRRKAQRCRKYRPDIARLYETWARDIDRRLRALATAGAS